MRRLLLGSILAALGFLAACGGGSQSTSTNPNPLLQSVQVTGPSANVTVGQTQQMKAMGAYNSGSSQDLTNSATWASSDSTVATVSSSGMLTANAAGNCSITAKVGAVTGSFNISVALQRQQHAEPHRKRDLGFFKHGCRDCQQHFSNSRIGTGSCSRCRHDYSNFGHGLRNCHPDGIVGICDIDHGHPCGREFASRIDSAVQGSGNVLRRHQSRCDRSGQLERVSGLYRLDHDQRARHWKECW